MMVPSPLSPARVPQSLGWWLLREGSVSGLAECLHHNPGEKASLPCPAVERLSNGRGAARACRELLVHGFVCRTTSYLIIIYFKTQQILCTKKSPSKSYASPLGEERHNYFIIIALNKLSGAIHFLCSSEHSNALISAAFSSRLYLMHREMFVSRKTS